MSNGTFEKVTDSDTPLYGPRMLLLCGFAAKIQPNFQKVLEMADLSDIHRIWLTAEQRHHRLSEVVKLADGIGSGEDSQLPRAIIVSGILENELHNLMGTCRAAGMKNALWAVLTPVSETWQLQDLLDELIKEREAIQRTQEKKKEQ